MKLSWAIAAFGAAVFGTATMRALAQEACSSEQLACVSRKQAALAALQTEPETGNVCGDYRDAYSAIAGCVGAEGCSNVDITAEKDACLNASFVTDTGCSLDCTAISLSLSAQNYDEDPADSTYAEDNATAPAFGYNGRKSSSSLQDGGENFETLFSLSQFSGAAGGSPGETSEGNFVAVASNGKLVAISPGGSMLWTFDSLGPAGTEFSGQPVTGTRGDLFIGDDSGLFYRLDESAGELLQSWNLGGPIHSSAAVAESYVYVAARGSAGSSSTLHKLKVDDEALMEWRRPICNEDELVLDYAQGDLALTTDGVVIGCKFAGSVSLYDSSEGGELWGSQIGPTSGRFAPASPSIFSSSAVDSEDSIYVTFPEGGLAKLSGTDGSEQWRNTLLANVLGSVAIDEDQGFGYAVDEDGNLHQFSLESGQVSNSVAVVDSGNVYTPFVDADGLVVVAAGQEVLVYDGSTLGEISRTSLGGDVTGAPYMSRGTLLVSSSDSVLSQTGTMRLELALPTSAPTGPSSNTPTVPGAPASPTPNPDGGESNTDDDSWPTAAIAIATILGVIDAGLAVVVVMKKYGSGKKENLKLPDEEAPPAPEKTEPVQPSKPVEPSSEPAPERTVIAT